MPETIYKGVPATDMPFTTVYWVAHERVPAEIVQKIVDIAYAKQDVLAKGHKAWAQMKPDVANFQNLGAPMHPGAEAYYKQTGDRKGVVSGKSVSVRVDLGGHHIIKKKRTAKTTKRKT